MELAPVRPADSVTSDNDVIISATTSTATDGTADGYTDKRGSGAGSGCFTPERIAFLKRNIPSIISLVSVILNVIIISALIPSLRNDVTYMQGQASSIQSQVNTMQSSLLGINDKINGADNAVTTFNRELSSITQTINTTRTEVADIQNNAISDIHALATSTLEQLNQSLVQVAALTVVANNLQTDLGSSVELLQNVSSTSVTSLMEVANAAKADLIGINTSVSLVSTDFIQRILPQLSNDLFAVNSSLSGQVQKLTSESIVDTLHYVGDPATGLGTSWINMLPYYDQTTYPLYPGFRAPRFWSDRNIVHLEGLLKSNNCVVPCTAFVLPPGYRPLDPEFAGRIFPADLSGAFGEIAIFWDGSVKMTNGATTTVSLDGISFLRNASVPLH